MPGGRPECPEAVHFVPLDDLDKAKGGYKYTECKYCRAAYSNGDAATLPVPIVGRPRNYRSHLSRCVSYQSAQLRSVSPLFVSSVPSPAATPTAASRASPPLTPAATPAATPSVMTAARSPTASQGIARRTRSQSSCNRPPQPMSRPAKRARAQRTLRLGNIFPLSSTKPTPAKKKQRRQYTRSEIKQIECALVELHADNHLSDRFIEQESVLRFLELICPGLTAILPSRRTLGGRVVVEHAQRCRSKETKALSDMQASTGGRVNLSSDVWMNISKEHNLGVQLTRFGVILTFALTPVGDRHDGLAVADDIEKVIKQGLDEGWNIGAIITDNAGQCGRARRILALRWPQLVFVRCFAHDINNLVKSVLQSVFRGVAGKAAAAVNIINQSSAKWLQRVRRLMKRFYGKTLGLRTLCATRWNSMQGCFASLLRVKTALQMLHHQYGMDSDFPSSLRCLGDADFWTSLTSAENVIAPLSYASYRLQRDENTVGDVVISYRDIYLGFRNIAGSCDELVKCVEERWRQCEQPLFMLGFALHPAYADHARALPTTKVSGLGRLPSIAVYYYRRLFSTEDVGVIRSDMLDWMEGKFTRTKASKFKSSPWKYWRWVGQQRPDSMLPKLAMAILSIAVNTATCERLFSELGLIHTALRNRMKSSKALDIHIIAKHVRQRSLKNSVQNANKKQLISPVEREILREGRNIMFVPSPPGPLHSTDEDGDEEDPGDGISDGRTLEVWAEYLEEVFRDEEIDSRYAAAQYSVPRNCIDDDNEFEAIPTAVLREFPDENDPDFPQEELCGFRAQKATLEDRFAPQTSE